MDDAEEQSFIKMLILDVDAAIIRHSRSSNQAEKRDLIRTTFAAIEGLVWMFRLHIIKIARSTENIHQEEEMALSEFLYQVSDRGKINAQPRYLPLLASLRLITRIASRIAPDFNIDFSDTHWSDLKHALAIRNRITHPKRGDDLALSEEDIEKTLAALYWLLDETGNAMHAANIAAKDYVSEFRQLLEKLKSGDQKALTAYHEAAKSTGDKL